MLKVYIRPYRMSVSRRLGEFIAARQLMLPICLRCLIIVYDHVAGLE
jgi:hypothetical protein